VLNTLTKRDIPWVVMTNGSAYPAAVQAPRLRAAGLPVDDTRLLTPSSVTAGVLSRRGVKRADPRIAVGHALREAGIKSPSPAAGLRHVTPFISAGIRTAA
jgi:ribonucleotide monophosphatase NagD (HAD superfamily)